ncbi:MAG: hypothetical protein GXW85_05200 [Clostridia bacterium]|nr:hypothetical protein [Clostridia bacterium]
MKKALVLVLVTMLFFSLTGCGVKDKIEQKVTEKVVEKVVESALSDENTKVDNSEGKITVKGKDGEALVIGETKWPDDIDIIPQFKEGKVVSVIRDNKNNAVIGLEEVAKDDFEDYLADIKGDFTENVVEMNLESVYSYSGQNSQGNFVQLTYDNNSKMLTIAASKGEN